jgi:2-deoxy-D-gluconate 3-dehydrogenase
MVTGAGTGLGAGMAVALAEAGADVVLVVHTHPGETADRIRRAGRKPVTLTADLSDTPALPALVENAVAELGRLDILVNNAGIIRRGPAVDFTEKDWDDVVAVNAKGLFFLAQAAARHMIRRGGGKIVNIASLLSFSGGINVSSYTASKGAVAQVTKALSNEWAPRGINVNAIAPGYMETDNTAPLRKDETRYRQITERIPAGRWGTPRDLAGAVVFLSSAASDYVHGHVLVVDGGWMAR